MNGGPGASSLAFGSFSELGPFYFDDHSMENTTEPGVPDVMANPYSWTGVANMLFIESPPSVGFSYCARKECRWNDTTSAETNYHGILKFLEEFDEFKNRDFYIAGESCTSTSVCSSAWYTRSRRSHAGADNASACTA